MNMANGSRFNFPVYCPNYKTLRHDSNVWNKTEDNCYKCNDCGCNMTMWRDVEYYEEEVE